MALERNYLHLDKGLHLHFRSGGAGFPIVLLHPSPRSSRLLEPFGEVLQPHFQVFLPDLFGYGQSDPLPEPVASLYDYLPYLKQAFDQLGLTSSPAQKFGLYGSATGAQLAIAFANTFPDSVAHVFLDNAAEFTDAQRTDILTRYFVDATPQADGSHVSALWNHIRQSIYAFPWYSERKEDRIRTEKLPDAVEAAICADILTDYLIAGPRYADAYRAAFEHERVENVLKLTVPTTIFRWAGSPILKYIDQLNRHSFPPHIQVQDIPATGRFEAMLSTIIQQLKP
jgi:pimeloyl-ACP methyl ester carboxylesterase